MTPVRLPSGRLHVDAPALAAILTGASAAVAVLTGSSASAAIAVVGLVVIVMTLQLRSPWLMASGDLASLALSYDDLTLCFAAARSSAARGSEPEVALDSIRFVLSGQRENAPTTVTILFRVRTVEGHEGLLAFDRPPSGATRSEIAIGRRDAGDSLVPWRLDPSWHRLVTLSWVRMQPFVGTVVLRPLPAVRGRRRYWEITYGVDDPDHDGRTTSFRLRSTGVYRSPMRHASDGDGAFPRMNRRS